MQIFLSRSALLGFRYITLCALFLCGACTDNSADRTPVTLQRGAADGASIKVVPVYHDERDKDARERLLASIECTPYDVLDEGTYTGSLFGATHQGNYYLYIRFRCIERLNKPLNP